MPDSTAYMYGMADAANYDGCNADQYGFEDKEAQSYIEGYGDQMDINTEVDSGICPQDLRGD